MAKVIDFSASTSEKLRAFARLLETNLYLREMFDQSVVRHCVCGLGSRINEDGSLDARLPLDGVVNTFAERFGVTWQDADNLFIAAYSRLGVGRKRDALNSQVTPNIAARVLRDLARKYEAQ